MVSETIRLPIRAECRPNVAPVDPIAEALFAIGVHPDAPGRAFHLCHPRPQCNAEVIALIAEAFGVTGKVELQFVSRLDEPLSWTERMMARSFKPYLPYLNESCVFDLTNTRSLMPDYDSRFPDLDLEYLEKVIQYQRTQAGRRQEG